MKTRILILLNLFLPIIGFSNEISESIVVDLNKAVWVSSPNIDDPYTREVKIPIYIPKEISGLIIAQYDEGCLLPYQQYFENYHPENFIASVDIEFDTRFVISGFNDYGITQTEFILHPADVKEPDVNGIQKEKEDKHSKVTIYTLSGMKVWDGTAEELKTATNLRPKGGYLIKTKKGTKKIFLAP